MHTNKTISKAQTSLDALPKLSINPDDISFLDYPHVYKTALLDLIANAKTRIYICALYWQHDAVGQEILDALYAAKIANPKLEITVLVDWHRAQRGLLGSGDQNTNARWYNEQRQKYNLAPEDEIKFYGIPINTREVFGVLHIKGFVFDDTVLYSGASINNVYLGQPDKYRYDRYQIIHNPILANNIVTFINTYLLDMDLVQRLDHANLKPTKELKQKIKEYRKNIALNAKYDINPYSEPEASLGLTPIFGLGANDNQLNTTIENLFTVVDKKLTICTPYFNFPKVLNKRMAWLLKNGKEVEIIVGDRVANDFYVKPDRPFHLSSTLPYLYEGNLRKLMRTFDQYIQNGQLKIRLWKDQENTYHLKGIWVDDRYILLTGHNLNPRAWRFDAENALLINDKGQQLSLKVEHELTTIRSKTTLLMHYTQLEPTNRYPKEVKKVINRFKRLKADGIVRLIL